MANDDPHVYVDIMNANHFDGRAELQFRNFRSEVARRPPTPKGTAARCMGTVTGTTVAPCDESYKATRYQKEPPLFCEKGCYAGYVAGLRQQTAHEIAAWRAHKQHSP
jgi:hypothetical protein